MPKQVGSVKRKLHLSQRFHGMATDIEVIEVSGVSNRREAFDAAEDYMSEGDDVTEGDVRGASIHLIPLDFDYTVELQVYRFLFVVTVIIDESGAD